MTAPRIALISPNRNAWSETFIANHVAHLAGVELVLTDGHLPKRDAEGRPLVHPTLLKRVMQRVRGQAREDVLRAAVERALRRSRANVVLAEYGPTGEAMVPIAGRLGLPLVAHFHGIDAFHRKLLREHHDYHRLFSAAHALVAVSREMEQQLISLGAPREKVHYNCYGIDVERFQAAPVERSPEHLLAVGRFVDKKAPHLTLSAFAQARRSRPELRLTMAGEGPLRESCMALAHALGVADAVAFPGVLTQAMVADAMQHARAFVQHSMTTADNDHEGTPLGILEAMASALPVISTRHGGIPDVITHEHHGLLSAEGDVEAMAANLLRVAGDASFAARLGRAGREQALRDHRLPDSLQRLHGIVAAVT